MHFFRLLILCVLSVLSSTALAGNEEGVPIGVRASMTGSAVTASVADGSAAWYNPAGIAHTERSTLDLNVSIYGMDIRSNKELITTPAGNSVDGQVTNWKLVPSAFAMVRQLTDTMNAAIVVFIPQAIDFVLQAAIEDESGDFVASAADIGSSYYFGAAMAWKLSPKIRFGFTLYGTYLWTYRSGLLGVNTTGGINESLAFSEVLSDTRYGLRANTGVQWDILDNLTIGASVMTPSVVIITNEVRTTLVSGTVDGEQVYKSQASDEQTIEPYALEPLKFRLGLLTGFGRWEFEVDASLALPIDPEGVSQVGDARNEALNLDNPLERDLLWNVSAGALFHPSEKLTFGAGLFTDLNPFVSKGQDYVGTTIGLSYRTTHELEGGSSITVESALGGRYAYGWGKGLSLSTGAGTRAAYENNTTVHELSASIGSSVHF